MSDQEPSLPSEEPIEKDFSYLMPPEGLISLEDIKTDPSLAGQWEWLVKESGGDDMLFGLLQLRERFIQLLGDRELPSEIMRPPERIGPLAILNKVIIQRKEKLGLDPLTNP